MGATSGIGALAVTEAVGRGLPVRAFARSADNLEKTGLIEPFAGDARSADDVTAALAGARAELYTQGIKERLTMLWEEEALFSDSTLVLIEAMKDSDTKRLVAITGFGAGRSRSAMSSIERLGHRAILGRPYADKDRQEAMIMESEIDWTIVRPVILTNSTKSCGLKVLRDPSTWRNGLVSRRSVACYLVDAVEDGLDIRADVILTR